MPIKMPSEEVLRLGGTANAIASSGSIGTQTLDVVLALILAAGGGIGSQFGVRAGQKLRAEQLRALLAVIVLAVAIRLLFDLVLTPSELYRIVPTRGA